MNTDTPSPSIPHKSPVKKYASAVITVLTGLVLSVLVFFVMRGWENHSLQQELEISAKVHLSGLVKNLESSLLRLEAIHAFYAASREVERHEFRRFVKPLLSTDPSIQALEWIPKIAASQREAYEKAARLDGFFEFKITERKAQGEMVKAAQRAEYFPVYFLEPLEGNELALGFDLGSNPARKQALQQSRDSGKMVATSRIKLVQDQSEQFGVLTFLPVYAKGKDIHSVAGRREHLTGFVLGVFRIGDIVKRALSYFKPAEINFVLYDMSAPLQDRFLYLHTFRKPKQQMPKADLERAIRESKYHFSQTFEIAGRKWSAVCAPTSDFVAARKTFKPWLALCSLLFCSGILAFYFFESIRHRTQLLQAYQSLQEKIDERKLTELSLRDSEERFRVIFEQAAVGVAQIETETGQFFRINQKYCNTVGYAKEEMIETTFMKITHPDDLQENLDNMQKLVAGKIRNFSMVKRYFHKDGSVVWVNLTVSPMWEVGKKPTYHISVIEDITERKLAEEKLRASEDRFRTLVENAPDGVLVFDVDLNRFVQVNASISQILGYKKTAFLEKTWLGISAPTQADGRPAADLQLELQAQALAGSPVLKEWTFIDTNGKKVLTELRLTRLSAGDQNLLRASVIDIGEKKRLEARFTQSQRMDAIAKLAGGVAHEFNNALSAIVGNIELLKMDLPKKEALERHLEPMRNSAQHMAKLTNQLLAYARGGKYQAQNIFLSDFVKETLPLIRHSIAPSIHIETNLHQDTMAVTVDTTQMQMLLSAVLQNASEAIEKQGRIKVLTGNEEIDDKFAKMHSDLKPGPYVCLTIEDDGKGMDEKTKNRIFEPFFTTKSQGRGIGMAAVYGIIKNHNGWILVDSELGKGTKVRIYLPAFKAQTEKPKAPIAKPYKGTGTILLIEDEETVMEVNCQILERLGYRVLKAKNGNEAVRIAETFDGDIDLAILDIVLPDMGGKDVYPLLIKARTNLAVIVCSGYSLDSPAREILDAGAQDFIQKPFSIATLSSKLKKFLSPEQTD